MSPHASACDDFAVAAVALEGANERKNGQIFMSKQGFGHDTFKFISFHFISFGTRGQNAHTHTHVRTQSHTARQFICFGCIEHLRMRATQFNRRDKFAQQTKNEFNQKVRKVQRMANGGGTAAHRHTHTHT